MQKILFLTIRTLKSFEAQKSGLDYLKKFNKIETLNICDYLPNFSKISFLKIFFNFNKIFKIIKIINQFKPSFIFVEISSLNISTEIIKWFILFSIKDCKLIFSENQLLPPIKIKRNNLSAEFNPRITSLLNKFFLLISNKKNIILKIKSTKKPSNKSIQILVPSRDADRYIESYNSLAIKNESIIFLDEMFTDHPDFNIVPQKFDKKYISNLKNPLKYYNEINRFLKHISEVKKLPLLISPHPKHNIEEASEKFNFPISQISTLNEVAKADLVIAHSSASINFAILLKKPIILYKSQPHEYSFCHRNLLIAFQKALDLKVFDYKTMHNFSPENITINNQKYQEYIDNYLLPKGIYSPSYKILNKFFIENL